LLGQDWFEKMKAKKAIEKYFSGEVKLLLNILSGSDVPTMQQMQADMNRLLRIALLQRVAWHLLQYTKQHPYLLSGDQLEWLSNRVKNNASRSLVQLHELLRVCSNFNESGTAYACIKGPQLARMLYGKEALKESVDLDIMLVKASDLGQVHRQLAVLGYTRSNLNDHKSWISRKIFLIGKREVHYFNPGSRCSIDLHLRAGANTYLTRERFRDFYSDLETYALENSQVHVLPQEKYLVYLCYHGALHQFSRLGWMMDIRAFFRQRRGSLNFQKMLDIARSLRVERHFSLAMILMNEWFGDTIPEAISEEILYNRRIHYLAVICSHMLDRDAGYGLTLKGRFRKLLYMMVLIEGMAGKIDLLYGIFMRNIIKIIRWMKL
jgi:hypothetical protein